MAAALGTSFILQHRAVSGVVFQPCSYSSPVGIASSSICQSPVGSLIVASRFPRALVSNDAEYGWSLRGRQGRARTRRTQGDDGSSGVKYGAFAALATSSPPETAAAAAPTQVRPTPAEAARTIVEICTEGTLSTLMEDDWPTATTVLYALDSEGRPVFRLTSSALLTRNLALDNRSSLHVQLEQPGKRRPQCTLRGRMERVDESSLEQKLDLVWERSFGKELSFEGDYYIMNVDKVLHAQDMGEEEAWVSGSDFAAATADPLRECAPKIVEDMNRKHWEDIRRFCNSHANIEAEVEEASMTWIDRLGFDLRVLTKSPQTLLEIRIPFARVVSDERDARSSLTMMAQISWEQERSYTPPDVQLLSSFNVS